MTARVLTVAQQKGGAGKTTLVAHLAVAWARADDARVAILDIDPQRSLTAWNAARKEMSGRKEVGGDLAPITVVEAQGWRVRTEAAALARDHDIVLVDSPPHAETESRVAVRSATRVVIPVQPSPMDVWATRATLDLAADEKRPVTVVLNRVPARAALTDSMRAVLDESDAEIAAATLGNRTDFAAALVAGKGVHEWKPKGAAAREIRALARELWARMDGA